MPTTLDRITIYPIKSLDGVEVEAARVRAGGMLDFDRRWALVDADGRYVNGKRTAAIQRVRAQFDLARQHVQFNQEVEFSLVFQLDEIGHWLSAMVQIPCRLVEDEERGFPDDTDAPGPTLISTATFAMVAHWFPALSLDELRRRFRANLEIGGGEAFWEDRLVGPAGTTVPFSIGHTAWLGINPCQRCVVPTRDSATAEPWTGFQKTFATARENQLPDWASRDRFNHFYRLAVNTRPATSSASGWLQAGDRVELQ